MTYSAPHRRRPGHLFVINVARSCAIRIVLIGQCPLLSSTLATLPCTPTNRASCTFVCKYDRKHCTVITCYASGAVYWHPFRTSSPPPPTLHTYHAQPMHAHSPVCAAHWSTSLFVQEHHSHDIQRRTSPHRPGHLFVINY